MRRARLANWKPALAWLTHPATVSAVLVLLLNDHFLKHVWPGPITGKLSDVAGLLVAPPLLALLIGSLTGLQAFLPDGWDGFGRSDHPDRSGRSGRSERFGRARAVDPCSPPVALASLLATGAGFALVKSTALGASLASQAWSIAAGPSVVLADPSDLIALPALGLAWLVWRHARDTATTNPDAVRVLIVVPVAMFAVVATPAPYAPDARAVGIQRGLVVVDGDNYGSLLVSRDGGATWMRDTDMGGSGSPGVTRPGVDAGADANGPAPLDEPAPRKKACVPDEPEHCYRAGSPALRVQETIDGGTNWTTVWEVSAEEQRLIRQTFDPADNQVYSAALAVLARPEGHVVVVANRRHGIAVRDVAGTWRRLSFTAEGAPSPLSPYVPPDVRRSDDGNFTRNSLTIAAAAGALVCLAVLVAALRRRATRHRDR
ncbi:hypothetical protein GCM10022226_07980 [Sphaerisporangium flaviroseum]|uniref:Uncharacterized protein n=1 Tax=Sphaerisporangium flaviroseum TaxID=509199 RepID=A0ABP7HD57_9ACTN